MTRDLKNRLLDCSSGPRLNNEQVKAWHIFEWFLYPNVWNLDPRCTLKLVMEIQVEDCIAFGDRLYRITNFDAPTIEIKVALRKQEQLETFLISKVHTWFAKPHYVV